MSGNKIFAVLHPYQEKQIGRLCWGDGCGKGVIGAIDLGESMAVRCNEQSCVHEEKRTDPIGELDGVDVCVRMLIGTTVELGDPS